MGVIGQSVSFFSVRLNSNSPFQSGDLVSALEHESSERTHSTCALHSSTCGTVLHRHKLVIGDSVKVSLYKTIFLKC